LTHRLTNYLVEWALLCVGIGIGAVFVVADPSVWVLVPILVVYAFVFVRFWPSDDL
jgi:uncharacterized membrane protein YoaK (UPF0700 family)